jgi:hypothetical protein
VNRGERVTEDFQVARSAGRHAKRARRFPVTEDQVLPGAMAAAREAADGDPSRIRIISVARVEVLSVPWHSHPAGKARNRRKGGGAAR